MGIILGPLHLALAVHLLPGLWLGATGVFQHPDRSLAMARLLRKASMLFIPSFFLPFIFCSGRSVDLSFMFLSIAVAGGIIAYGYAIGSRGSGLEKCLRRIDRAAAFLVGGAFPVAWFSLSGWLLKELHITWTY